MREVQNDIAAFEHGRRRLSDLPLSMSLVRESHERLLRHVRGQEMNRPVPHLAELDRLDRVLHKPHVSPDLVVAEPT